ncbi:hypothetical protein N7G274_009492 [Stereocaulon virgatum]|uniref:Uncharacterized protein n=1 Tax=Stereocaulon virgatum TaxID=373712 RepID=A0ABR3ZVX9_9LECA
MCEDSTSAPLRSEAGLTSDVCEQPAEDVLTLPQQWLTTMWNESYINISSNGNVAGSDELHRLLLKIFHDSIKIMRIWRGYWELGVTIYNSVGWNEQRVCFKTLHDQEEYEKVQNRSSRELGAELLDSEFPCT